MTATTALLVVDGLHGIAGVTPVLDALPAVRPRAVLLSSEDILAKLSAWEADYVAGQAEATIKALRSDWNQYLAWCEGTRTVPLPLSVEGLVAYVNSMIDRDKMRATIDRHLFSISTVHDAAELPNPVKQPMFRRKFKACIKRLVKLGHNVSEPATALTRADIDTILASLEVNRRMVHLRDAALLSLAADTLCRESELVAATVEQFVRNDLDGSLSFDVGPSKTNQEGLHDYRYVSPETWELIMKWRDRAGIRVGPLFLAVSGRKRKAAPGAENAPRPMHAQEVARIFRKRAENAGLGAKAAGISGHSARIGGANELACAGEDVRAIADAGGWRDLKQVMHYTQAARAGLGAQARLRTKRLKRAAEPPAHSE